MKWLNSQGMTEAKVPKVRDMQIFVTVVSQSSFELPFTENAIRVTIAEFRGKCKRPTNILGATESTLSMIVCGIVSRVWISYRRRRCVRRTGHYCERIQWIWHLGGRERGIGDGIKSPVFGLCCVINCFFPVWCWMNHSCLTILRMNCWLCADACHSGTPKCHFRVTSSSVEVLIIHFHDNSTCVTLQKISSEVVLICILDR